jgi:phage tail protein X
MAYPFWIYDGTGAIAFADYSAVQAADQRVFEANEGLTETVIDDITIRSTQRILYQFGTSDWWRTYYVRMTGGNTALYNASSGLLPIPNPDPNKIRDRTADFTDLCVYYALSYYVYPKIADFSSQENAERVKIGFFNEKFRSLYQELIDDGSWYDWSGDGVIPDSEKMPVRTNVIRVR